MTTHRTAPLPAHAILSPEERAMLTMATQHQSQQPIEEVATAVKLPVELLHKLVRDRVLLGVAPAWQTDVGTCDFKRAKEIAEQLHAARQPVDGNGILIADAAERYEFNRDTIYTWLKAEWVQRQGTSANGDILVNEGDIAFARALADLIGHRQGKPVFPTRKPAGWKPGRKRKG